MKPCKNQRCRFWRASGNGECVWGPNVNCKCHMAKEGEDMKFFKLIATNRNEEIITRDDGEQFIKIHAVNAHSNIVMMTDDDGEWVRREDAEREKDKAFKAGFLEGNNSKNSFDSINKIRSYHGFPPLGDVKEHECTCRQEHVNKIGRWWVCPAHGYKERIIG